MVVPTAISQPRGSASMISERRCLGGVAVVSERLRNHLDDDGPQVGYLVSEGGSELRQDDFEFGLGLSSCSLRAQIADPIL
jgi:hypothetical protein